MSSIRIYQEQQRAVANIAAQQENQPRPATQSVIYTTSGNGHFTDSAPVMFDCLFTQPPTLSHGMVLIKAPDPNHYQYPVVNAGVYQWITKASPADAGKAPTDPNATPYYAGAYLYFVVQVDPLIYPRTDGSDLAYLETQLTTATDSGQISAIQANIKEAQEALYLSANPPQVTVEHHVSFDTVGMKSLPDSVLQNLQSDKSLAPNTVNYLGSQ